VQRLISVSFMVVLLGSAILWVGCGASTSTPGSAGISAPQWYLDIPSDPDHFYAVATARARDIQFAADKAKNNARVELGQQLQTKISGLFKQFREETGAPEDAEFLEQATSVSKAVVSEAVNGSKLSKQEIKQEGVIYHAYVLMEMAVGEANAALMAKIKASENLYTRFRASQGFKELEKEVEKYEQWKKEQGM
jgi:hypothetical protein